MCFLMLLVSFCSLPAQMRMSGLSYDFLCTFSLNMPVNTPELEGVLILLFLLAQACFGMKKKLGTGRALDDSSQ